MLRGKSDIVPVLCMESKQCHEAGTLERGDESLISLTRKHTHCTCPGHIKEGDNDRIHYDDIIVFNHRATVNEGAIVSLLPRTHSLPMPIVPESRPERWVLNQKHSMLFATGVDLETILWQTRNQSSTFEWLVSSSMLRCRTSAG